MPTTTTTCPPGSKTNNNWDHGNGKNRSTEGDLRWKYCMKSISRCEASPGIRVTSVYSVEDKLIKTVLQSSQQPHTCMKRLVRELRSLIRELPSEPNSSIWIRFDEDTPQFMRAIITAPEGTPYAGGMFAFDLYVPNDYPLRPPYMTFLTTGRGSVRFGPNLYADGTVCLSLLGSWVGPQWNSISSNIFQLLLSIQGLILGVEQPYYLEPGRGGWEGTVRSTETKDGDSMIEVEQWSGRKRVKSLPWHVRRYNSFLISATVQWAMLDYLCRPSNRFEAFQDAIQAHFYYNGATICQRLRQICEETPWRARSVRLNRLKNVHLPELEALIMAIKTPTSLAGFDLCNKEMLKDLESVVPNCDAVEYDPNRSLNGVAYQVQIPELVSPGGQFCVAAANQRIMLCCPENASPGMSIYFRLHLDDDGRYNFEILPIVVKGPPSTDSGSEATSTVNEKPASMVSTKSKSFLAGKGKKIAKFFSSFRKNNTTVAIVEPEEVFA